MRSEKKKKRGGSHLRLQTSVDAIKRRGKDGVSLTSKQGREIPSIGGPEEVGGENRSVLFLPKKHGGKRKKKDGPCGIGRERQEKGTTSIKA